jgi:hypothetical protein
MARVCAQCGTACPDDGVLCVSCGCEASGSGQDDQIRASAPRLGDAAPALLVEDRPAYVGNDELTGIGGWLILVAISLAVNPILLIAAIAVDLRLLGFGLAAKPGLAVLIMAEAITNTIMLIAMAGLNVLFYRRMRQFPRWMITYLIAGFVVALCDHIGAMIFAPSTSWLGVFRSLIGALIWIPYFLQSQRVEQTFVK